MTPTPRPAALIPRASTPCTLVVAALTVALAVAAAVACAPLGDGINGEGNVPAACAVDVVGALPTALGLGDALAFSVSRLDAPGSAHLGMQLRIIDAHGARTLTLDDMPPRANVADTVVFSVPALALRSDTEQFVTPVCLVIFDNGTEPEESGDLVVDTVGRGLAVRRAHADEAPPSFTTSGG